MTEKAIDRYKIISLDIYYILRWVRPVFIFILLALLNFVTFSSVGIALNLNATAGGFVLFVLGPFFILGSGFVLYKEVCRLRENLLAYKRDWYFNIGKNTFQPLILFFGFFFVLVGGNEFSFSKEGLYGLDYYVSGYEGFIDIRDDVYVWFVYFIFAFASMYRVFVLYGRLLRLGNFRGVLFAKVLGLFMVYLSVALFFSAVWMLLVIGDPSALSSPIEEPAQAIYFSVVTLTTLGYGDYYPVSSVAMLLAIAEVVIGVFFASLIVGLSIGYTLSFMEDFRVKLNPDGPVSGE